MAILTWDTTPNDGAITADSGTWDVGTTSNWTADGGTTNTTWTNGDTATFIYNSITSQVITLDDQITLAGMFVDNANPNFSSSGLFFSSEKFFFDAGSSITLDASSATNPNVRVVFQ